MVCIPPHHELRKRKSEQAKNGTFIELPLTMLDAMKGGSFLHTCTCVHAHVTCVCTCKQQAYIAHV